jgi:tetratricopeptide (TPR) repeat protein
VRRRVTRPLGLGLSIVLLAAAARSVAADDLIPSQSDPWIRVQTAHFTFYSDASERRTIELARRLERFRASLSRFNKKFRIDPPVATSIFVFKDDAAFTPYKIRFNGRAVELSGLFVGRADGYYVLLNGAKQGDPLEVIYHEYTHHYLDNNLHNIPLWYNEGLAECYSTFRADDKTASIGLTKDEHVLFLREHHLMPLHDLFRITHDSPDYNEGDRRGVFYAESWLLMHYLMWDKPERHEQFLEFLDRLSRGEEPDTAFPASFRTSYEGLEKELLAYAGQARFMYTPFKIADLGIDDTVRVAPMKREELLARLGDLLAHVDEARAADAETLLREAQKSAPDEPTAYAGLGYLAQIAGRLDDAVGLYDKAVAFSPDDPVIYFHLGQCLERRATASAGPGNAPPDLVRAEDMFGRAIRMRPGFAEAYLEYARVVAGPIGSPKAAIPLLEAARSLLPSRIDVLENLVLLYARTGNTARAHDLVENVLARMNDREALEQGRSLVHAEADRSAAPRAIVGRENAAGQQAATVTQAGAEASGATQDGTPTGKTIALRDDSMDTINDPILVYNKAVALANRGDYKAAIGTLQRLLKQVPTGDLHDQIVSFVNQLRKDAARLHKPTE